MKKLILIVTLITLSFAFLSADVYIKQQTKSGPMMGQPAKESSMEQWLGSNKIATITDTQTIILNLEAKKMFMVSHKSKTYIASDLPVDFASLMPDQAAAMMKGVMDSMTVSVAPNGQSKKVGNWDTTGYDVTMGVMGMEIKMTIWASTNVGFDLSNYKKLSSEMYKIQLRLGEKFIEEFKKIDGYPVLTEMNVMGSTTTVSVVEINPNKTPTPGVYDIPAGYTKKDKIAMEDMQQ